MLRIVGRPTAACDGVSRRDVLRIGGLSLFGGLTLPRLLRAGQTNSASARSVILLNLFGGPSHIDMFDLKPSAPAEIRGEFKPIATSVPGLHICEHLPRTARIMHKVAIIRSMHHAARLHDSASIHALTGRPLDGPDRELFAATPQFFPSYGGAVSYV